MEVKGAVQEFNGHFVAIGTHFTSKAVVDRRHDAKLSELSDVLLLSVNL